MQEDVRVRREQVVLPTYAPAEADKNPMFLEKRVYQGSSGKVYPLPFVDCIEESAVDKAWDAVVLENEYVTLTMLPEIGGRIFIGQDRTNGYDFFYRQNVIKPALVGLAGPWISGGVEFNWPQHHRPSTFMPTDVHIEHGDDGSVTVWMSEHEPMNRMKGMHGVCLHPGRSVIELKVRLYNRTPYVQTFLWWANIATHVHEAYRSFFPQDAHEVADHAKRAVSAYPLCDGHYYGVDYGARGREGVPTCECPSRYVPSHCGGTSPRYGPNDLSWYANIPVPTSYMCLGTREDFFGGYDYRAEAGLLHIADHHIAPGKKQWTWGNHEFGYAWDRNLTDADGPYIELMAGVYTDNQPDFSYLSPGETKTFSQFWYPYQGIGIVHSANLDVAIGIEQDGDRLRIGVASTRFLSGAQVAIGEGDREIVDLSPDRPYLRQIEADSPVLVTVLDAEGNELGRYENVTQRPSDAQSPATEPPLPAEIGSADELFLNGLHLEQYRHATRSPVPYWLEALRRDASDVRCNNAMGRWHFQRGEFEDARGFFERAVARATFRNPNPYDGEPYYNLGLALRFLGEPERAADAFAKAAWNSAWQAASYHALAELACARKDWQGAMSYLDRSLRKDADNLRAWDLKAMILRAMERAGQADRLLKETLELDPLDHWALWLSEGELKCDNAVRIDLALDLVRAGFFADALSILGSA
ncbi:MAG TPA: DUF5107 domain-containing protein, partial [Fimbriimonas sp.]